MSARGPASLGYFPVVRGRIGKRLIGVTVVLTLTGSPMRTKAQATALSGAVSGAHFYCSYNGELYAKTTLAQEFRDASLVVRVNVLSSKQISIPGPDEDVGVLNRIKVAQIFKGKSPTILIYYSRLDSGGFYLDVGTDYLLFLDPI